MVEWLAVIFFCLPGGECRFWVGDVTFANKDKCAVMATTVAQEMYMQGVQAAPTCLKIPEEKSFERSS